MSKALSVVSCTVILFAAADRVQAKNDPPGAGDDAIVVQLPVEAPVGCATMFDLANFGGQSMDVADNANVLWIGGPWNERVSSINVKAGCILNAYAEIDFGGAHDTFGGTVPWVGDTWSNQISSFTCTCQ